MLSSKYLLSFLFTITMLTACGGGGGTNNDSDSADNNADDDSVEMNDDSANADDDNDNEDDVVIIDDSSNASVSWTIGGNRYSAEGAVDSRTFENEGFAILSVDASQVFSSQISITYTLTGSGSYYISGSPGSVGDDSEENQANPKRIGILVQENDPSSSLGVSVYQTLPDSGFIQVTVDGTGKYHFDIPSSSPISLGSLILGETTSTVDLSMTNVYDFR